MVCCLDENYLCNIFREMKELTELLEQGWNIKISNEHRRCEVDSYGTELPYGRGHYSLFCWRAEKGSSKLSNEWPGFWTAESAVNDMLETLKNVAIES